MTELNRPTSINTVNGLASPVSPSRDLLIGRIFADESLRDYICQAAEQAPEGLVDQTAFLSFCKQAADAYVSANGRDGLTQDPDEAISAYIEAGQRIAQRFEASAKPNPKAVYWPDPTKEGENLGDVLPVSKTYPFIDQSTVIASAGSCFAVEIAKYLVAHNFNYLCLEKTYDPETGTIVLETSMDDPQIQYSCRWGNLFNTPSFTQVVENAFGVRPLSQILTRHELPGGSLYLDPYREAVAFMSEEGYAVEREKHLANTRKVFETADVFIMTLGLNEAWQYIPDGSYISRNPRDRSLAGLLDHRTLTVQENIDYLQRFVDVVRAHNPDIKLIVTVSPVPFLATGRADEHHVVTANTHSKAVLRVTAEEIVARNENVFYFPSYEVVTVCSPQIWKQDQRHIHESAVGRVMATFEKMFLTRAAQVQLQLS
ncbi:MAG TPA: hypothetical protein DCG48_04135 [Rhodospirillaceae bacterium]|nr:hypothetical protein [Rhodospirillaceae bacterium]|tara:strand:- start:19873 stop:21159 length:1287 start_codon:yes stop_codon:yes gene_type:complete